MLKIKTSKPKDLYLFERNSNFSTLSYKINLD